MSHQLRVEIDLPGFNPATSYVSDRARVAALLEQAAIIVRSRGLPRYGFRLTEDDRPLAGLVTVAPVKAPISPDDPRDEDHPWPGVTWEDGRWCPTCGQSKPEGA